MISIFPEMARSPSDVVGLGYPIIDKWCTKAVLSATLNGSYTAEFTIPHKAKGVKRELLPDVKQVIKLIDMDGDEEYFRVRRFKHNLKETVITAEHISYDLIDNLIEDINNVDKDGQGIMDRISAGTQYKHPFRLTSDILKTANIRMVRMNPIQALIGTADNTFVNRLGGELKRKQFTLAMNESIGIHRTDVIRSRRNLTGFEREINLEDYATRIMPRAKNGIELPEKYVDSPHIDPDHPVIKVIDYSDVEYDVEFKDLSDSDKNRVYNELRACAKADFAAGRDVPNASYEVDFITLRNTVEYADYRALENYNLGDTVSIYEADYDVEIEAKVISFEWDVLKKRYTSMKLGSFKNGIVRSNFNKTNSVDAKISQAQSTADIALLSADGKTTNFYGTGEPVNPKKGDTWFKKNGSEEEVWQYQEVDGVMMWVYVTGTRYANALKESIAHDFSKVTQQIAEQQQAHDRTVAEILSQVDSTQSLAEQAKAIGDQAKADAVNLASQLSTAKTALQNSINDTKSQIATVNQALSTAKSDLQTQVNAADAKAVQAQTDVDGLKTKAETIKNDLNTAKSELQTRVNAADAKAVQAQRDITQAKSDLQSQASQLITQAAKQVELTKLTTETKKLADGTLTSLNELTKTVDKATGDITSVTNRTKTVEDSLASVKTNYTQLNQTVNAQTGQIDSINQKTAQLESGFAGVTERFESLQVGGENLINNTGKPFVMGYGITNTAWNPDTQRTRLDFTSSVNRAINNEILPQGNIFFGDQYFIVKRNQTYTQAIRIATDATFIGQGSMVFSWFGPEVVSGTTAHRHRKAEIRQIADNEYLVWSTTTWNSPDIKLRPFDLYNLYTALDFRNTGTYIEFYKPKLETGSLPTDWCESNTDFNNQITEYKRTAEQNYSGLQSTISTLDGKITQNKTEANQTATQLSNRLTSLETYKNAEGTRAQAYFEAAKTETAKQITAERTAITQNYVAKSTYQEDAAGVTRRLTATETVANRADTTANSAVTKATNAQSTADTAKANVATVTTRLATYQETNDRRVAALETAKHSTDGTLTQLSNKVEQNAQQTRETISAVESKIPTKVSGRNLATGSSDQWNSFITISSNNNWGAKLATVLYGDSTGIYAGTTINIFVYLSADDIVLDSTINPRFFIQGAVIDKQNKVTWTDWDKYNPFFNKWSTNLVAGNNYRVVKLSSKVTAESYTNINGFELSVRIDGAKSGKFHWRALMITTGDIFPDYWEKPVEDLVTEISNAKLDITKTAEGLKLAATKTELTNAQNNLQSGINAAKSAAESAQAKANSNASTITQHATQITALNNELSAKVSKTDYNTLTGRMTSAETTIQAQAGEISKRLTSTQVESAITAKGYQTKAQVDSNIAGRGYITSSALQPYATTTVLENKVRETVDSFNRTISSVRLEIPSNTSMRNLILKSSDKWGSYTSTNNANSNWCPEICRITLDSDRGISVGKKLNLFVYISADNVTLDSSSNHRMAIQALIKKKDGTDLWHVDVPFYGQWSQNLKAGNNYYVIKLTKEIKATAYENGATLIVQCRIDGANHVDFHHRAAMITTGDMFPDTWYPAPEDLATVVAFNKVSDTVDHHAQTLKDQEGRINTVLQTATTAYQLLQDGGRIYEDLKTVKGQIQQVIDANYATRIETLAGSWAVKNLTSGGQILNQINLLANGINHIDGRLTHITGDTLIDRGVIKSAMIGNGQIGTAQIGTIDASQANIININAKNISTAGLTADVIRGGTLNSLNGNTKFSLDTGNLLFLNNGGYIARENGGVVSKITTGVTSSEQSVGLYVYKGNASDIAVATMNDSSYIVVSRGSNLMSCSILTKATRYYFSPPKVNSKIGDSISINFHYNQNPASTSSSVTTMIDAYSYTGKTVLSINDITLGHFTGVKDIIQKLCDKAGIMWI